MMREPIRYAIIPTSLGWLLAATTDRGLWRVGFGATPFDLEAELRTSCPDAAVQRDEAALSFPTAVLTAYLAGTGPYPDLPVDLCGTPFQRRVWEALRAIPYGTTRSYGQIAADLGLGRNAARAIGRACAANQLALLVPCHRAVDGRGRLGGFRWGLERKRALLAMEGLGGGGGQSLLV